MDLIIALGMLRYPPARHRNADVMQVQTMNDPRCQGCRANFKIVYYTKMCARRQSVRHMPAGHLGISNPAFKMGEQPSGTYEAGGFSELADKNFVLIFQLAADFFLRQWAVVQGVAVEVNIDNLGISYSSLDEGFR